MAINSFVDIGSINSIKLKEQSSDPSVIVDTGILYQKNDLRPYILDSGGNIHDLSIQHRQVWKPSYLDGKSLLYQNEAIIDVSSLETAGITRFHSVGSADAGCTLAAVNGRSFDVDWANTSMVENASLFTYNLAVDNGAPQKWTKATHTILSSTAPNYGSSKVLTARIKIDDSAFVGLFTDDNWSITLVLQEANQDGVGQYTSTTCAATTSWADYSLSSIGDTIASPLVWSLWIQAGGIGAMPAGPCDLEFKVYIDYITLTQWTV